LSYLLQGKVAIFNSDNSGIWKSIVECLAPLGAKVLIDHQPHPGATEAIQQGIAAFCGSSIILQADVDHLDDL
jgi:glucose 1-dehydrogenase